MLTKDGFAALTLIYDAATNLGRWRRALDAVAGTMDAKAIALLIRRPDPKTGDKTMLNSSYLKFQRSASGLYYGLRYSRLQEPDWSYLSRQPAHHTVADLDLAEGDTLDARADYAYLRKKIGVRRRVGVRLNADKIWFDAMSIAFDKQIATVPRNAMDTLTPLLPHLTKSVELGRTFFELQSRYKAVLSALDHVHVGLAIALPSGELIVENAEMKRLFDLDDGMRKAPDARLHTLLPEDTAQILAAVRDAASTARGEGTQSDCLISLARPSGRTPFLIDIAPLNDSHAEIEHGLNAALISVIDPTHIPTLRIEKFTALYDLTTAEAEVCALLVQGLRQAEIAEARDTSPVTTKNQIASIFAKTGTRRQADLIRLVIRVLPPVN